MNILQVFEVLDTEFSACSWPVPPSSILLHLPFKEMRGDENMTREEVLMKTIQKDKKWRNWEFKEINPRVTT